MPRSNRPRRGGRPRRPPGPTGPPVDPTRLRPGGAAPEQHPDGEWLVRPVAAASKDYRCPGCDQVIVAGTAHVVAWPAEQPIGPFGGVHDRRHWHRACWTARRRRR